MTDLLKRWLQPLLSVPVALTVSLSSMKSSFRPRRRAIMYSFIPKRALPPSGHTEEVKKTTRLDGLYDHCRRHSCLDKQHREREREVHQPSVRQDFVFQTDVEEKSTSIQK